MHSQVEDKSNFSSIQAENSIENQSPAGNLNFQEKPVSNLRQLAAKNQRILKDSSNMPMPSGNPLSKMGHNFASSPMVVQNPNAQKKMSSSTPQRRNGQHRIVRQ